jgi:hypothetical protein
MKKFCVAMAMLITIFAVGCGDSKAVESALGVPTVKNGILRPGEDCVEVYFEWDTVEGADGYEVSEESKYYSETEYREPENVEITDNFYVASAQDYFDFRIKVRAFRGNGAERVYGEWSSFATGSAYEKETIDKAP